MEKTTVAKVISELKSVLDLRYIQKLDPESPLSNVGDSSTRVPAIEMWDTY